jgi:hypothetical protein
MTTPSLRCPIALDILAEAFEASARWEKEGTSLEEQLDETIGREHQACYLLADFEELVARFADLLSELPPEAVRAMAATVTQWEKDCLARRRGKHETETEPG